MDKDFINMTRTGICLMNNKQFKKWFGYVQKQAKQNERERIILILESRQNEEVIDVVKDLKKHGVE